MAITDTASHALLIDGKNVETKSFANANEAFAFADDTPEPGTVWINEHLAVGSEMPRGGVKGSGSART